MADERSLSDLLWDYGVYAPIGLAVSIAEELPRLSDKGRERASSQIVLARAVGKMAVGQGKRQLGKLFGESSPSRAASPSAGSRQTTAPTERAARPAQPEGQPAQPEGAAPPAGGAASGSTTRHVNGVGRNGTRAAPEASPVAPASSTASPATPSAEVLAIPGYDTLAASQVVQRLSSLRPDELEAIRRYELSTRGRRTILHRIAQLAADQ